MNEVIIVKPHQKLLTNVSTSSLLSAELSVHETQQFSKTWFLLLPNSGSLLNNPCFHLWDLLAWL